MILLYAASRDPRRGESPVMCASTVQVAALPGEVVSNTSAKERQHKCEVLISEAMGIASVQNPFTDRNMPYEQPFQPDAGDEEAVPIFVILSPIC